MIYASGRVISHSLYKRSSKFLQFLPENLQHTQYMMNKMRLSAVNFIRKSWSKSFNNGIVYSRVSFKCICATVSRQYTELFYKLFTKATEFGRSMVGCNFRNNPTHQCTKIPRRENVCLLSRNFQSRLNSTICNLVLILALGILLKPWTLSFKKDTITAKIVSQLKCLEERKKLRFTLQIKDLVSHSSVRISDTFSEVMLVTNME